MCIGPCIVVINEEEEPTKCYLVFYYTYDRLNIFRAPLCPSSGAHYYTADYHMSPLILRLLMVRGLVQAGWLSVWAEGYQLVFTVLCVVVLCFLYCFVYVYLFLFVFSVLV
jgi:hypothetical protein